MIRLQIVLTGVALAGASVFAQISPPADPPSLSVKERAEKTIIEFELIGQGALSDSLKARQWGETLPKLGASVRIRQPTGDDAPGVTEKTRGPLRWVTVIGTLNSRGDLVLPDRKFSTADGGLLKEWIDELKLYGAQGAPEGQPVWGLSEPQFNSLFSALGRPIPGDAHGESLHKAIEQLGLPPAHPVRFHSTALQHLAGMKSVPPVRQHLAGMSVGSGFAAVLADCGLGYRPLRTPDAAIELVVQPLSDIADPWPVGWAPKEDLSRDKLAPALFKMVPVEFDNIPLQDVLDAISQATQTPIVVDHYAAAERGIDLNTVTLSYPSKRTAWIIVINSVAARNRMVKELRIDEHGHPFVHIAPFVPRRLSGE